MIMKWGPHEIAKIVGVHSTFGALAVCYETSIFISFLDYWQLLIGDTSTTYYTDVAIRVTMTLH